MLKINHIEKLSIFFYFIFIDSEDKNCYLKKKIWVKIKCNTALEDVKYY